MSLDQPILGAVTNRLRLNLFAPITDRLSLSVAYDCSPRVQDPSLFEDSPLSLGLLSVNYRATDFDSRLYPDDGEPVRSFAVFQNLDRLYLTVSTDYADIYLGRQAIAWGSARVINPTDILAPFAYNELDVEDRVGVDAIRVRVPLGFMGEVDAGYVFGHDFAFDSSAVYLRTKFYYRRTDVSLLAIGFRENLLLGVDLTRAIGGAGSWIEGAYVLVGVLEGTARQSDEDYFRGSIGLDYSLRDGTYLFAEYHFNDAGAARSESYLSILNESAYAEGSVYLLGRHYFAPGISYQVTPLVIFSGEALINLIDPSLFFVPQIEYNIAEDIYLSAGAYLGLGQEPEYSPTARGLVVLRSEFGSYPDFYFASFRVYF